MLLSIHIQKTKIREVLLLLLFKKKIFAEIKGLNH